MNAIIVAVVSHCQNPALTNVQRKDA